MRATLSYLLSAMLFVASCGSVAGAELGTEKRLVNVDDYFTQAFITDCETSPNGRFVAYVELRWELPRESRNGDIWVVDTKSGEARRLTFESASDSGPHWSPNGEYIYFTSSRTRDKNEAPYNGKSQVWRIQVWSGLISPVTRLKDGIGAYELAADGNSIYYSVSNEANDDEWAALRKSHASLKYGRGKRSTSQIWRLDLKSWRTEKLVDKKQHIHYFSVSPNQKQIAMVTASDDLLITNEGASQVDIFDLGTKKSSQLPDSLWRSEKENRHGWLEHPVWSEDSSRVAFRVVYDGYPAELLCAEVDDLTVWQLKRPEGVSVYGGEMVWHQDCLLFVGDTKARTHVYQLCNVKNGQQGAVKALTSGDLVVGDFSIADNGVLSIVKADPQSGLDIFLVQGNTALKRLTNTNPQMAQWKLPQVSIVQWKGADGDTVEGILELPPDYDRSQGKIPTIVQIHGGPTSAAPYCFRFWPYGRTLLPSKGFALLMPNYHGSTGYGDAFMTDLVGRENDIEVKDIMLGIDWLIDQGIADPDKLGVMGWSNGGFLTNAMITSTTRFKAASSGAGVVDQVMQWGLEDTPGHVINFMSGKLPWEDHDAYRKGSPLYGLGKVTTPTLIHVGENDPRVPAAHSKTLFRGLNHYGKAPTQLVIYPGAGHSPMTYPYRKAKMEWDVAWFERYVMGKEAKTDEGSQ